MKFKLFDSAATVLGSMIFLATAPALAITVDPFPATGQGGAINGQSFKVGPGGGVFQLEGYVSAAGAALNGVRTARQTAVETDQQQHRDDRPHLVRDR